MKRYQDLLSERSGLVLKMRSIHNRSETEKRELTPEERTEFDELKAKIDVITQKLSDMEALESAEVGADPAERSNRRTNLEFRSGGLPDLDGRHKYSLLRVIRAMQEKRNLDGIEREVSDEIARATGRSAQGYWIPTNGLVTHREMSRGAERRDLTTTAGAGSIAAILSTDFIDILRNRMLTMKLGAQLLDGMTGGTFSIPRQTAASAAYWVAEGTAPTASDQAVGQVTFTPKTIGAFTDLSRKFILQTSLSAEAFVKADLAMQLAIELDRAALNGSGTGAQPQGLIQKSITTISLGTNGAAPTYGKMLEMEQAVAVANADLGELAYLGNNYVRNTLKQTLKRDSGATANTSAKMIWEDGEVNGYKAHATNQIPNTFTKGSGTALSAMLFGYWPSLVFGQWGAVDLIEDPYTKSSSGGIRIVTLADYDIQNRYDAAFCKIVDMITV